MKEEDPVEEVVVEEEVVEEVPSVEPHVIVSAAAAASVAPATGFHFMQESELEAAAEVEAEAPYDEQVEEEPIQVVVEETVAEETGDGDALEVCYFSPSTSIA